MADENQNEDQGRGGLPDVPMVRLRTPSGVIIHHTLPLHETIDQQWRKGELERVGDGDLPYEGDQYDLSDAGGSGGAAPGGEAAEDPAGGGGEPARPGLNDPKAAWQEYAAAIGACTGDEAATLTRQQLIDKSTPPEMNPAAS